MRILVWLNLVLVLAAIGVAFLIREYQILVEHDGMLHWAPVREGSAAILLPLENSRAGSSYFLEIHLSLSEHESELSIGSGVHIHGQDLEGNIFNVFSGEPVIDSDRRTAEISFQVKDDGVSYVAVDFDNTVRSQVDLVGVGASTIDIKAHSAAASITRNATRNLMLILGSLLLIQIASLFVLGSRRPDVEVHR